MNAASTTEHLPDDHSSDPFIKVVPSVEVLLNDGSSKLFPCLDDYIQCSLEHGIIKQSSEIRDDDDLVIDIFRSWVSYGQTSCSFAKKLAVHFDDSQWLLCVEREAETTSGIGETLCVRLDAAAPQYEAVQFIFPDIETPEQIAHLVNNLCISDRWYLSDRDQGIPPEGSRLVSLRWILPSNKSVNHVLGFAPFATTPLTRRAPFVSLALRVHDELRAIKPINERKLEDGRVQVHLADMESGLEGDSLKRWWDRTEIAKQQHVEPHLLPAARARITFCLTDNIEANFVEPRNVQVEKVSLERARKVQQR